MEALRMISFCLVHVYLSYDVASGSEIKPCNKIDKPLVIHRFRGNVMMVEMRFQSNLYVI